MRNLASRRRRVPAIVLTYHLVADRDHYLGISTDEFIDHLDHLTRCYRVVSLGDIVSAVRTGAHEAPRVALTFDDGYAENAGWSRELCALYEVPATVFACANLVDGRMPLPRAGGSPSMDLAELRSLAADGVEIGSHTCSHADCGDPSNWAEIPASRHRLEAALERPVRFFSFPYGAPHNCPAAARPVVAAAGYEAAFTAFGGTNVAGDDLLALKRVSVPRVGGSVRLEAAIQGWMPGGWFASRRTIASERRGDATARGSSSSRDG
jgi:peptidoglycan/xylan/chitin deacetylase (PgdA/CDA1 family)